MLIQFDINTDNRRDQGMDLTFKVNPTRKWHNILWQFLIHGKERLKEKK